MKKRYFLLLFFTSILSAQETDVFLFDLTIKDDTYRLSNPINVSNKSGYDNQPQFIDNSTLVYSSTRENQTDIAVYNVKTKERSWLSSTKSSEFSPTKIPNQNSVSAIKQGLDNSQKLVSYSLMHADENIIIDDLVVGYHTWINDHIVYTAILENDGLALYETNTKTNKDTQIISSIGRSLNPIKNGEGLFYINATSKPATINLYDSSTKSDTIITKLKGLSQDFTVTPNNTLLMADGSILYQRHYKNDSKWIKSQLLSEFGIKNITRLAVSPDGTKMAVVAENNPVKASIEDVAWIQGNWTGEAFGGVVEENWSAPKGDSMMASFKLVVNEKVQFYELEIIREFGNSLVLQLKHFNKDLAGWETKKETVDFPLLEILQNKIIFEGMTFELIDENHMNVSVDLHQKDGSIQTYTIKYSKS